MTLATERIVLTVNGQTWDLEVPPARTLLDVLREDLDLTGAKMACDDGECGSCFVLLGKKPTKACLLATNRCQGKEITTIEGLTAPSLGGHDGGSARIGALHPLQEAFLEVGATQCGFCIPGMIMKAEALLRNNPDPTREDVIKSLSTNLCRCTGYVKIIDAVLYASELLRGGARRNWAERGNGGAVGSSVKRLDTPATVTGEAKYAADLKMEGMLYAKLLCSPHHHAQIRSIDTAEAAAMSGVEAVITAADIPGSPVLSNCQPQTFVFPADKVRFLGEAVAAVAATSEEIAAEAVQRIKVEYEPLPAVLDIGEALKDGSPPIFASGDNVSPPTELVVGDLEKGFAAADSIVEHTYDTERREHAAMEPEAALAYGDEDGRVVIKSPLYHPFIQGQQSIAATLGLDVDRVRIVCPAMGGNFGTRGDTLAPTVAALLALKTKKPVRIVFARSESLLGSCKTPSTRLTYKIGATKDGRLVALEAEIIRNVGSWAPHLSAATTKGAELCCFESIPTNMAHPTGPYSVPNVRITFHDVVTNGPRGVPLRGTSGGYMPFAIESQMDMLATELELDPLEFRLRNALDVGSRTHLGQVLEESVGARAVLEALRTPYDEAVKRTDGNGGGATTPWKRGIGIGCAWRSITNVGMAPVAAAVKLLDDGRVEILAGTVEQGQGAITQFAQIVSEELAVPMESLVVTIGDTFLAPYPVPTFSSITTVATAKAVHNAAIALKESMTEAAAQMLGEDAKSILFEGGIAFSKESPRKTLSLNQLADFFDEQGMSRKHEGNFVWQDYQNADGEGSETAEKRPNILYGYNGGLAEVEVNVETGEVRVLKVVNATDAGTVVNPQALEGQAEGAVVMGIGIALSEGFHSERPANFKAYGLPTTKDMPRELTPLFVGEPYAPGPFGAKSAGEIPILSPMPSILNAIANAIGARVYEIPATPDRVLAALARHEHA